MSSEILHVAAMYAVGALPADEAAAFEQRLLSGDADAARAMAEVSPALDVMWKRLPKVAPPPSVRDSLLNRIRDSRSQDIAAGPLSESGPSIATLRDGAWEETGVPGARKRTLFIDRSVNRMTVLFKLDPGATYPDHQHAGVEECYVVQGDLHIAGTVLGAGDYQRALPGTDHGHSFTTGGCVLLITCPAA